MSKTQLCLGLSLIMTSLLIVMTSSHCFHGNAARTCQFTCHCAGGVACDHEDGECEGGCDTSLYNPWTGPGCQRGGVGVGKHVIATYRKEDAHYCIDDIDESDGPEPPETCHLGHQDDYHVTVDLGTDHVIEWVRVLRADYSVMPFVVLLDINDMEVKRIQAHSQSIRVYFEDEIARYVRIPSTGLTETADLYEIRVYGYQYVECEEQEGQFYYGPGCLQSCGEGCAEQCHMIRGDGCEVCHPGYEGLGCKEICRAGYWGQGCVHQCQCDEDSQACDHKDGQCIDM